MYQRNCDRCGCEAIAMTMSRFNTQMICVGSDSCIEKEERHPEYQRAKDVEFAAVKSGNLNFKGIGLPEDLR